MKNQTLRFALIGCLFLTKTIFAQWSYRVELVAEEFSDLPALHSYVFAQKDNQYLVIGGRKDGIHPRQPWASFDEANKNTSAYVIDVDSKSVYSASLSNLNADIYEQLSSTNMNFHQVEDTLYIIGGYGYSNGAQDHITYPNLTTVQVSGLMNAIIQGSETSSYIHQIKQDSLAVTGGHLNFLDGEFYLVGGHRFDGRYNPMGHNTYTQEYTHEVRKFKIDNSGTKPVLTGYSALHDEDHLRRRDYNLVPQIFENGEFGFLISSGVFQKDVNLPFLYPIQIKKEGINPITGFNQYLSNYHSASVGLYDETNKKMHSLFFGGISQYNLENEKLIKDDQVPFVKTISLVSQSSNGQYEEFKLGNSMPTFLGGSAEFWFNYDIPLIEHEIVELNKLEGDTVAIGYIYGGIQSSSENPFTNNASSEQTQASSKLYRVELIKDESLGNNYLKKVPGIKLYPNPNNTGKVNIKTPFDENVKEVHVLNQFGQLLQKEIRVQKTADHSFRFTISDRIPSQVLYIHLTSESGQTYRNKLVYLD